MQLRHWRLELDGDDIAWLAFDCPGTATNTFSSEALRELIQVADHLATTAPKGLAIWSAKDNGFAAGADIEEFSRLTNVEEGMAFITLGNDAFDRIAALPFPTVALVHGFCMGGATELALACRYRVADDGPKTRFALPEVLIGIVPGWGGVKRLPPLIGAAPALDLMLTGRGVDARKARRLNLVNAVMPRRYFRSAARDLIVRAPGRKGPPLAAAASGWPVLREVVARISRKRLLEKVRPEHYPAPFSILALWKSFGGDPLRVPADHPQSMQRLIVHPTTRNLIRVFKLQERLKALGKAEVATPFRRVHVVGAGAMGGDIAAWCAVRGLTVTLQDLSPERIAPAIARADALFRKRLKQPHLVRAARDRLIPDPRGDGVAKADVVIEAIVEKAEAKRDLYSRLEPRMQPEALLATNTSSIPLEQLSGVLARPERLLGLHFFNPVAQMMLVEVVSGPQTSPAVAQAGAAFARAIDKLPLPCKSAPGFLVNRVLSPYLLEAMLMIDEGVPAETIDAAARAFGMPMGPVELADLVGLDICRAVGEQLAKPGTPEPKALATHIAAGRLGKKTGRGFYDWSSGKPRRATGTGTVDLAPIADRLLLPALNEAVACVREGIVADADLCDAGVIFGTGFAPHRGGPVSAIRERGAAAWLAEMSVLRARHGDRFTPDAGWPTIA